MEDKEKLQDSILGKMKGHANLESLNRYALNSSDIVETELRRVGGAAEM